MKRLFEHRNCVAGVFKIQILGDIVFIRRVRYEFVFQHFRKTNNSGIFYRVDISLVARNYAYISVASVRELFNPEHTGDRMKIICKLL